MRDYVVKQLREVVIPALERVSGRRYDEDRLREHLRRSAQAEDDLVCVLDSAKHVPSPIDGYFGAVYYVGPIFSAFRGTEEAVLYYRELRTEVEERMARGEGPVTPDGPMTREKYRLVVEGPPNWTHFREFWRMFHGEGAVVVASTYTKVGGVYDEGFRHDPDHPLETLADYCLGCYTNRNLLDADRHDRAVHPGLPGRRVHDQLDQVLRLVLGRATPDPARGREEDRGAGRVLRERPRRPEVLLGGEHQEPDRVLPPDARPAARREGRLA